MKKKTAKMDILEFLDKGESHVRVTYPGFSGARHISGPRDGQAVVRAKKAPDQFSEITAPTNGNRWVVFSSSRIGDLNLYLLDLRWVDAGKP